MSSKPNTLREAVAKEALGEVPSWREAKLNQMFYNYVMSRQAADEKIKELEADKDNYSEKIFEALAATGLKAVQVDDYRPTIIDSDRRSISAEKLLELGVPASVIEKATEIKHSTFLRVFDTAKASTRGKEKRAGVVPVRKR